MEQDPENGLSGRTEHEHAGEAVLLLPDQELRSHLIKHHGWNLSMVMGRGKDISYCRSWHRNAHAPAPVEDRTDRVAPGF